MLQCVAEDPIHCKIRLQRCSNGKTNQVSYVAHLICLAFFCGDGARSYAGEFAWQEPERDVATEAFDEWRAKAVSVDVAKRMLDDLGSIECSAASFGKLLAAASVVGQGDLARREGKGKDDRTLLQLLRAQCSHYCWLQNYGSRRCQLTEAQRCEQAVGTASNEAFHREVGRWSQGIQRQTWDLLRAKMTCLLFLKLSCAMLRKYHAVPRSQGDVAVEIAE